MTTITTAARALRKQRKKREYICDWCDKDFLGEWRDITRPHYCCNACKCAAYRFNKRQNIK